jgi:DNA-binding XRE family transcriptional regulator
MSIPQIITTPSGEELVVIPKAEYDAMVEALAEADEDAADIAAYDAAMAEIAGDGRAVLPEPVSAALTAGDSLLKALRKWRGLSQVELAEKVGVAQGYISDLEASRRQGAPETIARIAAALDIPELWLARR